MKKFFPVFILSLICLSVLGQKKIYSDYASRLANSSDDLDEKIGQLNQYTSDRNATGKITSDGDKANQVRQGKVGSMLNVVGAEETRELQELALQSRLKNPHDLLGLDVIHGFRTTFPIPLGETATWDLAQLKNRHI